MSRILTTTYWKITLLLLFCTALPSILVAQNNLWQPIEEANIPKVGTRYIIPTHYTTLKLDLTQMREALDKAPMTKTAAVKEKPAFLDIPWPDGSIKTFQIIESPIMEQGLMDKFPEIKTYAGSEVGDEGKYIRLDLTPQGFHAMVLTAGEGTVYIDPYSFGGGDLEHYICYFKKDFIPIAGKTMVCGVVGDPVNTDDFRPHSHEEGGSRYGTCELRTYRLAVAATGEYTTFHGGTVALAQAAQVTTMNRVNGVYLRDMAIQMNIVANNNLLIYTNAGTDPYTNGTPGTMITENQNNVTTVIGSANYDIGHVFGTNSGGLAGLGVICNNTQKARGVTGSGAPVGDPFDIDYVAHEMGHQFGANHTFNNSCGGNRNNATAMEPGSGSTIMAYAGICAPNVQNVSDDYFHGISLEEISNRIIATTCPVKTPLSNSAPTITSTNGSGITLPISTPFALTAVASDPNATNVLTYCWEQMDNAVSTQAPVATSTGGPNFRSLDPSTNPTRYFPSLASQATGGPYTWEVLPSVTRTMNFRVSVRDNATGGTCSDHENISLSFTSTAGPFVVTYPTATGISWPGNSTQTVTWTVANTDIAPVACANVNIYLSTDGGLTYPTLLASNVPNDGSQIVTVPNTATTTARIMVMCANGTFFDISNNNFTITAATNDYTLSTTASTLTVCQPANGVFTVNIGQIGTYTNPVTLSVTGVPVGATATFGTNPVGTPGSTTLTISNTGSAAIGSYTLTLTGNSVSGTKSITLTLNISGVPTAVTLTSPTNGATGVSVPTVFTWTASAPGSVYAIDIATDAGFTAIVDNATNIATTTYTSTVLSASTTYYWRIRASNTCGTSPYSSTFSFTTSSCATFTSTDVPKTISATGTPTITSILNIPTVGTITDVNVLNVVGTHTYIQDLRFSLTSPATTNRILLNQVCADQDNFNINFDDAGALYTSIPCPPTGGGTYQPQNTLAAFNGQAMNGTWTMTINDLADQDGGTLTSWALQVCYTVPCTMTSSITTNNQVSCNGGSNGSATASATGGTAPITYLWSNGRTTAANTGLTAGTYTVTLTDASSCTATSSVTITQPASAVSATISSSTSVTCNGAATGSATASGTGGTGTKTYLWSNGRTTAANTGLVAGTYTVTVSDANLCTATASVTISQPSAITATISSTNVACFGSSTGSATVTATGGTGTKTYLWSNGRTTTANTGLAAGTYTVTVTDANSCTVSTSVTITQPSSALSATTSQVNILCFGAATGSINLTPSGGTPSYTFNWGAGVTSEDRTGLVAGTYRVTITDANGCTATSSNVTITQPASAVSATISSSTSVTCNGAATGAATANGTGGTGTKTYLWSNGRTTAANTGLVAGTYIVTVSDANACTTTASVTITQPSAITATISSSTSVTCNGAATGSATANGTGGTGTKTYLWSNGRTTAANTGLVAGTYIVTVSDANACTATASVTITQPSAVTATISSSSSVTCNGAATGSATANGTGGTGSISYSWSNGRTTAVNTGLVAGTYTVTVSDANACTATTSVTITQPASAVSATISSSTSVTCNGAATGSATANGTGGTGTKTYLWSNGRTTAANTGLVAGTYIVTVSDANACTATASVTITQPASAVSATISSSTSVTCNGGTNGSATANGTGGTGTKTYLWSNGRTTAANTGLAAGTYIVTVSDANACTTTASVTISQPSAITATMSSVSETCAGNDGTATVTASGGTGSKTYLWNAAASSQTTATATGLNSGTYFVTVTDANGCTTSNSVIVSDGCICLMTASIAVNNQVSCNGGANGSATASQTGGTPTITYLWSNGRTTATNTGLVAGTYTVTVTDANTCTASASVTITQPSAVTATISSSTSVTCNGAATGSATANGTGGTGTKTYLWSNGRTTAANTGLVAGTYTVTVSDANACTATASVTISQPATSVVASISSSTSITCNGAATGSATANGTGGTGTITYLWSNGRTTAANTGLVAGTYTVTVSDANACTATASVTITQPATAVAASITASTNVTCNGGATGSATANGTGGTGTITYLWSNGRTTAANTGLVAGTYTVTASDANACTATTSATITQPSAVNLSTSSTDETCVGNDGTATASVSGGTGSYIYIWNTAAGSQTTTTATGLDSGTYSVTVTDANGCTVSNSVVVNYGCICSMTASIAINSQVSCFGGANGSATASQNGGTPTFTYIWSNGQTTATATGLTAGSYSVTITDVNSCTATASTNITEPSAAVSVSASVSSNYNGADISCNGSADGQATASGSGGTGAISYLWSNNQSNAIATGLVAGTYMVTATDANGCQSSTSIALTEPSAVSASISSSNAISCNGGNDGSLTATAGGGIASYSFVWSDGQTTQTAMSLSLGTYCVTATDINGCQAISCATLTEPSAINLTANVDNNAGCNGTSDGQATANTTGGTGAIGYVWSNGQTTATAVGLAAGTYDVTATDANGCETTASVVITEPTALSGTITDNGDGTASAMGIGGTPSYVFQWDAAAGNQMTATATGLIHNNTYFVTVTDANGCSTILSVTVNIVGLDDIPNLSEFNILPNPNNGNFQIQISFAQPQESVVKLTNVLGQELRTYHYSTSSINIPIDIQHQASGVYFVTLETANQAITRKVIVSK